MILFRADGNEKIGSGHLMRCLSLAIAFQSIGEKCVFIVADGRYRKMITKRGFLTIILDTDYRNMESELFVVSKIINDYKPCLIIVDSYYVTEVYLNKIRNVSCLCYIDDLGAFAYPSDFLVNYNAYGEDINYKELYDKAGLKIPELILGLNYAPLRCEFQNRPKHVTPIKCRNILISTGGADPIHLAKECIRYLGKYDIFTDYHFHFILGAMNPDTQEIEYLSTNIKNISLHQNVSHVEELMQQSDIAVSAAGSTLYELCACGVPTITYVLAENQIPGADAFVKLGLMDSLGDIRNISDVPHLIFDRVKILDEEYKKRIDVTSRMQSLIDGHGAYRLAKQLLGTI